MKLSAPKKVNWIISAILAVLSIIAKLIGVISADFSYWFAFASACLLLVTTYFSGV
ncbi:MAG: hypothetical protein K5908_08595 [Erysipelotrichaceae bacterium]|nr:hypothetical protein [Erysipelotrichaceae bacterium]